jgi:hypothetical protein
MPMPGEVGQVGQLLVENLGVERNPFPEPVGQARGMAPILSGWHVRVIHPTSRSDGERQAATGRFIGISLTEAALSHHTSMTYTRRSGAGGSPKKTLNDALPSWR